SRVIVHEDVKEKLEKRLIEEMATLTIGNGLKSGIKVGPIINQAAMNKIANYIEIGKEEGAKLAVGGKVLTGENYQAGFYFEPTLFTRSEEHTSELQSRFDVVCRLLLDKK